MRKFSVSNGIPVIKTKAPETKQELKKEIENVKLPEKDGDEELNLLRKLVELQVLRMKENIKTQENTDKTNELLLAILNKKEKEPPQFPDFPQFPKTISVSNFPKMEKTEFPVWEITNSLKKLYESQSETNDLLRELLQKEGAEEKDGKTVGGVPSTIGVRRVMGKVIKVETPVGTINGTNTTFRLSRSPFNGFLLLNLGGTWQVSGYTLSGNTITYSVAPQLNPDNTIPDHKAVFF